MDDFVPKNLQLSTVTVPEVNIRNAPYLEAQLSKVQSVISTLSFPPMKIGTLAPVIEMSLKVKPLMTNEAPSDPVV